jgi:PAS domain S-box-containing protein
VRLRDGSEKIISCAARLVSEPGQPQRLVGAVKDETERLRSEQLLRDSEERFRLLSRATSDAVWDWDLATGIVWRGDGYETLLGYAPGALKSDMSAWDENVHPDDREAAKRSYTEAIGAGQMSWSHEYRFKRADGTYAQILDRAYIVRDGQKKAVRMLGAMFDMTEQKLLEEQLEQAKRVSSLGRVAASIAHEFNNILMGIQPSVEVIQRSSPTGLRAATDNIIRAVQRGKRVTDEILRFTRPADPDLRSVSVREFFDLWRSEIEPQLGTSIELVMETDSSETYIQADTLQLEQVFTNLALNARDAMQEPGGKLTINGRLSKSFASFPFGVVQTPDRFVHFTIQDEGCGMSSDRLAHIFEPLFTTKRGGVGLGLAISYQIVTRHGGHIFVESVVGSGTTFHIFIPASLAPGNSVELPKENVFAPALRRILLVEDEPAVASGIAMLFETENVNVDIVTTGREAIPAIERTSPDAVILDIGLPDMDGVDVYLEIERRWPDLPVLFSSGHGDSAKLEEYLARPNVGFLLKPYDFEAMRAALSGIFGRVTA